MSPVVKRFVWHRRDGNRMQEGPWISCMFITGENSRQFQNREFTNSFAAKPIYININIVVYVHNIYEQRDTLANLNMVYWPTLFLMWTIYMRTSFLISQTFHLHSYQSGARSWTAFFCFENRGGSRLLFEYVSRHTHGGKRMRYLFYLIVHHVAAWERVNFLICLFWNTSQPHLQRIVRTLKIALCHTEYQYRCHGKHKSCHRQGLLSFFTCLVCSVLFCVVSVLIPLFRFIW